jgi:hypothetical protein
MPVQPAQPAASVNYNTDQFTDPVTGATVHDDGSDFYLCQANGLLYFKQRTMSGQYNSRTGDFCSYQITLMVQGAFTGPGIVIVVGGVTYAVVDSNNSWCVPV